MTRKFIHAVVPYNATADQANMVTDLLEGRGLPFSPNNPTMEIPGFVVTEYMMYPGDRLEPVMPPETDDNTRDRVERMFAKLHTAKSVGVIVSAPVIGCRVVHGRSMEN